MLPIFGDFSASLATGLGVAFGVTVPALALAFAHFLLLLLDVIGAFCDRGDTFRGSLPSVAARPEGILACGSYLYTWRFEIVACGSYLYT